MADGAEVWAMLLSPGGLFCSLTRLTAFEGPGPVPKVPGMGPWSKGDGRLTAATGRAVDDRVGGAVGSCGSWYPCLTRFWRAAVGPPWLPGPWHTPFFTSKSCLARDWLQTAPSSRARAPARALDHPGCVHLPQCCPPALDGHDAGGALRRPEGRARDGSPPPRLVVIMGCVQGLEQDPTPRFVCRS